MTFIKIAKCLLGILVTFPCVSSAGMIDRKDFVKQILGIGEKEFNSQEDVRRNAISFGGQATDPFLQGNQVPQLACINTLNEKQLPSGTKYQAGYFEEMPLGALRNATKNIHPGGGTLHVIEAHKPIGQSYFNKVDIGALQALPENRDAVFQVASNFNALEFVSSDGNELHNVSSYIHDKTQGPGASISAAPGTLFRDYYVFYEKKTRPQVWWQTADDQIEFLSKTNIPVQNGYVYTKDLNLQELETLAEQLDVNSIKIGFQGATQVTYGFSSGSQHEDLRKANPPHLINQVFTAAMDLGQGSNKKNEFTSSIAKKLLQAAYEGTLRTAMFKQKKKVILTLIGGGVFQNDLTWISDVLRELKGLIIDSGLDVTLIIFDASNPIFTTFGDFLPTIKKLVQELGGTYLRYDEKNPKGVYIIQNAHAIDKLGNSLKTVAKS